MALKFDGWPRQTIGHLFYCTSGFVHHFKSVGEFILELQSGNAQFGSKSGIFMSRVTLKFEGWPWKIKGHLFFTTPSFVHHFRAIGEFKLELQPFFTLEIWQMTLNKANLRDLIATTGLVISLKLDSNHGFFIRVALRFDRWPRRNNRAHLLYYVKFCASFQSHGWIQTGVTVRKLIILVNVGDFYPVWTWNLTNNLEKQ